MVAITRRAFQKLLASGGVGLAMLPFDLRARTRREPVVAVAKGTQYDRMLIDLLDTLAGAQPCLAPGDRIVIKPTMTWPRGAPLAANTHPQVVQALARLCLDAGAGEILVFDRTSTSPALCYAASGIQEALASLNTDRIKVIPLRATDFVPFEALAGSAHGWQVCRYLLAADRLFNVPVAKHHRTRGMSLAMSNLLGVVSPERADPTWNSHEAIVEINRVIRPTMNILDATRVLVANGPQGGSLEDVRVLGTIAASPDSVALDAYGCTLFGRPWRELHYLRLAAERGVGEADPDRVRVIRGGGTV